MKLMKNMKLIVVLIGLMISANFVNAQDFEGEIEFAVEYTKVPAMLEGYESMLPEKTHYYVKGSQLRTEVPMPMGGDQIVIFDVKKNEGVMLMNMMGTKNAITMSSEYLEAEAKKLGSADPNITYYKDYKNIAGYRCQKAVIEQSGTNSVVYFTDKIPNLGQNYKGLRGMPLQYSTSQNGVESILTATKVEQKPISNSKFEIPEEYDVLTIEEFMEQAGEGN